MKAVSLVFPHQLYHDHEALDEQREVVLFEDPLFFTQFHFHQKKLVLHRASMKAYADYLAHHEFSVNYVDVFAVENGLEGLFRQLQSQGVQEIHLCEVDDYLLERRLRRFSNRYAIRLVLYSSSGFFSTPETLDAFFGKKSRWLLNDFYIEQRKRHEILIDSAQKPLGGRWTFDDENRKRLPKGLVSPGLPVLPTGQFIDEAKEYVSSHFSAHPGDTENFNYPIDFESAQEWLDDFLSKRFCSFGDYQDAMAQGEAFLFHGVLTPMLNIGLLSPQDVVFKTIEYAHRQSIPMNSLEGFVRQVLGWREFVRGVYRHSGVKQRTKNYWKHQRKIPPAFWTGDTGIAPVDDAIRKTLQHGYAHHIERLMILGNFMLLCEFDPDEVYRWFMEMYIDSYDWVMVPNVYGMSQYADGGLMSTKPYISGSNYVLKMSNYPKGEWCDIWDGLFWRFISVHRDFFSSNFRTVMMVKNLDKMSSEKREAHFVKAQAWLDRLDTRH